jgi:hypothetical protein
LHDQDGATAVDVLDKVLPDARQRTPSQLRDDVARALLEVNPAGEAGQHAEAIKKRRVCHPKRLPNGMAGIWAVLSADKAIAIDATLEAIARAARNAGHPNTLDQLRADALVALATGQALSQAPAPAVDDAPARADATPGAADATAGDGAAPSGRPVSPTSATDDDAPKASPRKVPFPKVRIDVTVALSTLMGLDELPGELSGFGPVNAEQARALASGGTWRRIVTDPLSGAVLDVGRRRYKPPRALAEHVIARDTTCAGPRCSVPARRCDLDHTTEFHGTPANGSPEPGTTSADNLGPLCRRCHRLKTDGGFTLTQPSPGVFEWRTPARKTYTVTPGDHGHTKRHTKPKPTWDDDPPPF